jgi:exopolysaccharide production protein ExoY
MVAGPSLHPQGETPKDSLGGTPKRLFDIGFGSLVLVFTLPLLLIIAGALKVAGAGPVFKREPRLGFRGRMFSVIELATTAEESPLSDSATTSPGQGLRRGTRIARIGVFLHESGIHKLPQLVNVLRGEMSLVGPRALHPSEAAHYGERIAAYLSARPGLVQARRRPQHGQACATHRFDSDLDYIRSWSFSKDMIALLRTIFALKEL